MRTLLSVAFLFTSFAAAGQYTNRPEYDVEAVRKSEIEKRCGRTRSQLASLPGEVHFSAHLRDDSVFVTFPSVKYFWQFFQSRTDGVAIDIVNQAQYQCDNIQRLSGSLTHKGYLLEPVYRDEIKKRIRTSGNMVYVFAGKLQKAFDPKKVEANLMLIEEKRQCYYNYFVNYHDASWDLLDMGLYYDSIGTKQYSDKYTELVKTLRFTVPFQKNTSIYKKEDIRPLYDSLRLTDYEITAIRIHSFTSVEGTLERNTALQSDRAKSIVDALQEFQPEHIQSEIITNENWVEFAEDISQTPYSNLANLSKQEVKDALRDKALSDKLEPLLATHRKATIELSLEKRVTYSKSSGEELKKFFNQSLQKSDLDEALYLQEIIFQRIRREQLPPDFLKQLDIPKSVAFGGLLTNDIAFRYESNVVSLIGAIQQFEELNRLLGGNARVEYNICALQIKGLRQKGPDFAPQLAERIVALRKRGLPNVLVLRLQISFHLINSEFMYYRGDHAQQRKSVQFLRSSYEQIPLTDKDLVSLARYLVYNAQIDLATRLLTPRITALDASEDLLFYYVNMTMMDPERTSQNSYRTFLLNLVNANSLRFCRLFDPIPMGGVSFQLLSDPFLKKTFCENCNSKP